MAEHRSHKSKAAGSSPASATLLSRFVRRFFSGTIKAIASDMVEAAIEGEVAGRYPGIVDEIAERRARVLADEMVAEFWRDVAPNVDSPEKKDRLLGHLERISRAGFMIASELEMMRTGDRRRTNATRHSV